MPKLSKIVHEFVINEDFWLHGTKETDCENSALRLNSKDEPDHGKKCCLGFFAQSCGVKLKDITGVGDLDGIDEDRRTPKLLELAFDAGIDFYGDPIHFEKDAVISLMGINDEAGHTLFQRKQKIKSLFRTMGVGVSFTSRAAKKAMK